MRTLTKDELDQTSGAITCTLNPNPINLAELGTAITLGAIGGKLPGAILGGGFNYLSQSWICTWR
ncbi:hypothetical protein LFL97_18960 [Burkholderia sp. JSH-S8]|uniref:hypothetical protein n=1 Tax=Burkholderia stagnalis TaxID=1503054 RepID=UPI000F811E66|nr:hypothetical protein [Burkholderia stagnalis]WGS41769.1 hypothetical protein LFL97_18960 [Burkholderia sp. JSH-S8]